MSMGPKPTDPKIRLQAFIEEGDNGCWNFTGHVHPSGYGRFYYGGKQLNAQRASWLIFNGPIPNNLFVCHKCDNRRCVNPDHLFLGDNSANIRDCVQKGRHFTPSRKSHCIRGHDLALSKGLFNCRQCADIRNKHHHARKKAA